MRNILIIVLFIFGVHLNIQAMAYDIHTAVNEGHIDVIRDMINDGVNVNEVGDHGATPLIALCYGESIHDAGTPEELQIPIAKLLIQNGANVNARRDDGSTALHWASNSNEELAIYLVNNGADVNAEADHGSRPLYWAVTSRKIELIKLLLKKGANPNFRYQDKISPYEFAKNNKLEDIAILLKKAGAK